MKSITACEKRCLKSTTTVPKRRQNEFVTMGQTFTRNTTMHSHTRSVYPFYSLLPLTFAPHFSSRNAVRYSYSSLYACLPDMA